MFQEFSFPSKTISSLKITLATLTDIERSLPCIICPLSIFSNSVMLAELNIWPENSIFNQNWSLFQIFYSLFCKNDRYDLEFLSILVTKNFSKKSKNCDFITYFALVVRLYRAIFFWKFTPRRRPHGKKLMLLIDMIIILIWNI